MLIIFFVWPLILGFSFSSTLASLLFGKTDPRLRSTGTDGYEPKGVGFSLREAYSGGEGLQETEISFRTR